MPAMARLNIKAKGMLIQLTAGAGSHSSHGLNDALQHIHVLAHRNKQSQRGGDVKSAGQQASQATAPAVCGEDPESRHP